MYDADELKNRLNSHSVKQVLHTLGVTYIEDTNEGFIVNTLCHNSTGGSHKLYYYEDGHNFQCYTSCGSMSIYDLIIKRHALNGVALSFPESINWLAIETGLSFSTDVHLQPFEKTTNSELDWMNKFRKKKPKAPELTTYSEWSLQIFTGHGGHSSFTSDGISSNAMDEFDIRFDSSNNALIIPHRHHNSGKIIGMMSRNLRQESIDRGFKYTPTTAQNTRFNFPKHLNLYGFWENRETITKMKKVAIFESEKSVLQCETMFGRHNNFAVALGGKYLSDEQITILLKAGVEEVILNFDKDFSELNSKEHLEVVHHIKSVGEKLSPYVRVFATIDTLGVLVKNDSPSDKGRETLELLFDNKVEILNKGQE